jgi:alpha,alpha-trehalose phosphorylase
MIQHPVFVVEPWRIRETALALEVLAQSESIFALSNGHLGMRGNLDEGEPNGLPGTYLNSFYDLRPFAYGEASYGNPESSQTVINVTNGKLIRLLVDDEPFDVRYGKLRAHQRVLDMRAGTLERRVEWISPAGGAVRVSSVRLVSLTQRAIAAISYEVEPLEGPARLVVQSELVANEPQPAALPNNDPRQAAVLDAALPSEDYGCRGLAVELVHSTTMSGLRVAAAMDHLVDGPPATETTCESFPDLGRLTITTLLQPGQRLRLVKLLAYGWSSRRSSRALRDQVTAALTAARGTGWEGLLAEQRAYLDNFWDHADVELDGDPEVQQAVRFGLFHIMQAGARGEDRPIPAKGLTGPGYDGHAFWDTEVFVLPVLAYVQPPAVASALRWRHSTLPAARERAQLLGLRGAAFPWRTIGGGESSAYWPASTAAFHINADIADAVVRYTDATNDDVFERETGLELLVETARLWHSLGHYDGQGRLRIDGVTGPNEYNALADNNVYTNLMAQQNLRAAADLAAKHPDRARALGVDGDEPAAWRAAAAALVIPYDDDLGVHPQADGFTKHQVWDFAATPPEHYPLLLHYPYVELYRKQVVKQPDLVLAMHLRGDAFTDDQKARNFAYYEPLTVRDSSLAAGTQCVLAAEVGHLDLAYDYLCEAALMDLEDLEHNTRDGVHLASLAGAWIALVDGFGGMRTVNGMLSFAPRLPDGLTRLVFNLCYRDRRLRVTATPTSASYRLLSGQPLALIHHGELLTLSEGGAVSRPIPAPPQRVPPTQPPGRAPGRRRRFSGGELRRPVD